MLGPASNGLVSTTWGLSGVTESDRPVLGFAAVASSSCWVILWRLLTGVLEARLE